MAPLTFNVSTRAQWLISRAGPFTPEKKPWYPSNGNLDWPQSRSGSFGKNKNLLYITGIRTPDRPVRGAAVTLITLIRLSLDRTNE